MSVITMSQAQLVLATQTSNNRVIGAEGLTGIINSNKVLLNNIALSSIELEMLNNVGIF